MKVKNMYCITLILTAVLLLALGVPAHSAKMDDRIESSAKNSYVFKTYLKEDNIKIKSTEGIVSLTGTVSQELHKSMAQETIQNLPGVKSVDNKLEVKGERPAEKSDAWISAKIKTVLLFHKNVSAMTDVSTKNGIVTLKGNAANKAQADLTTEYAKDVEGVKDIKNEMTVLKNPKRINQTVAGEIDDASTTVQVKMSLLMHHSTSALNTNVTTKRGVVSLEGKARNAAEKSLVSKIVSDVKGVKDVSNLMTIENTK
ncbi:MAG: BON domain-containing protein [Nitrospirae bacterium]|nr:BON domain-containing protein [Nitrospirota bacterium]